MWDDTTQSEKLRHPKKPKQNRVKKGMLETKGSDTSSILHEISRFKPIPDLTKKTGLEKENELKNASHVKKTLYIHLKTYFKRNTILWEEIISKNRNYLLGFLLLCKEAEAFGYDFSKIIRVLTENYDEFFIPLNNISRSKIYHILMKTKNKINKYIKLKRYLNQNPLDLPLKLLPKLFNNVSHFSTLGELVATVLMMSDRVTKNTPDYTKYIKFLKETDIFDYLPEEVQKKLTMAESAYYQGMFRKPGIRTKRRKTKRSYKTSKFYDPKKYKILLRTMSQLGVVELNRAIKNWNICSFLSTAVHYNYITELEKGLILYFFAKNLSRRQLARRFNIHYTSVSIRIKKALTELDKFVLVKHSLEVSKACQSRIEGLPVRYLPKSPMVWWRVQRVYERMNIRTFGDVRRITKQMLELFLKESKKDIATRLNAGQITIAAILQHQKFAENLALNRVRL